MVISGMEQFPAVQLWKKGKRVKSLKDMTLAKMTPDRDL